MPSMPRPGDVHGHHTFADVSARVIEADESAVVFERRSIFATYTDWLRADVFREIYPRALRLETGR